MAAINKWGGMVDSLSKGFNGKDKGNEGPSVIEHLNVLSYWTSFGLYWQQMPGKGPVCEVTQSRGTTRL